MPHISKYMDSSCIHTELLYQFFYYIFQIIGLNVQTPSLHIPHAQIDFIRMALREVASPGSEAELVSLQDNLTNVKRYLGSSLISLMNFSYGYMYLQLLEQLDERLGLYMIAVQNVYRDKREMDERLAAMAVGRQQPPHTFESLAAQHPTFSFR